MYYCDCYGVELSLSHILLVAAAQLPVHEPCAPPQQADRLVITQHISEGGQTLPQLIAQAHLDDPQDDVRVFWIPCLKAIC